MRGVLGPPERLRLLSEVVRPGCSVVVSVALGSSGQAGASSSGILEVSAAMMRRFCVGLSSSGESLSGGPLASVGDSRCSEGASSPQGHHERVGENVPDKNRKTCYQPPTLGHHAGVDERSDVVLDKSALIASLPC